MTAYGYPVMEPYPPRPNGTAPFAAYGAPTFPAAAPYGGGAYSGFWFAFLIILFIVIILFWGFWAFSKPYY